MSVRFAAAITGLGVLSPIGVGTAAFCAALDGGKHAMRPQHRFSTQGYRHNTAAVLEDPRWDRLLAIDAPIEGPDPVALAALDAAWMAFADARLEQEHPERIALILGSSAAGLYSRGRYERRAEDSPSDKRALLERASHGAVTTWVADALGIRGPRFALAPACSSSSHAIAHGWDLVRDGVVDVVIAGGVELMVEEIFAGFHSLGLIADGPCAPFSTPEGMTVGEGAGFIVLERERTARARGAAVRGYVRGYGLSLDAFHAVTPAPNGDGVARAMTAAIAAAGLEPAQIDYVNAHATGTSTNDSAEWRAIQRVFGERSATLPVSATKSYFGHTQAAAGALEFIAMVLCAERGRVAPTLNYKGPRPCSPVDPVADATPREVAVRHAICCKSAFGGSNSALVYARSAADEALLDPPPSVRQPVAIMGHALLASDAPRERPRVDDSVIEHALRTAQTRGFDRLARLLAATTLLAAKDAKVRAGGAAKERLGLLTALHRPSSDSTDEFWKSVRTGGFAQASPSAFAKMVLSSVQGAASLALGAKGPSSVVSGGLGSTLASLLLARSMLFSHDDLDVLLLGSAQDASSAEQEALAPALTRVPLAEHSACFALARSAVDARAWVSGLGAQPPATLDRAMALALAEARLDPRSIDAVFVATDGSERDHRRALDAIVTLGSSPSVIEPAQSVGVSSSSDAVALAWAVRALAERSRAGDGGAVMVVSEHRSLGSFAAVLSAANPRSQ